MPIRFRCAYCNQLMGIARRKAGTVVRCPRCAGQVIVPNPEAAAPAPAPGNGPSVEAARQPANVPAAPGPVLFEQSDFEKLFEPGAAAIKPAGAVVPSAPVAVPGPGLAGYDVEPMADYKAEALPPVTGVLLTPLKLTLLSVAFVILLGLSFVLGLLVGRS
jgi:DNA-directed RNA polymerase subunit RPC12/RpoP